MNQYVFWRTPQGDPVRGDVNKHAPAASLAWIGSHASITPQGNVAWKDYLVTQVESAIRSAVVIIAPDGHELNATDTWAVIDPVITSIIKRHGGGQPITSVDLLKEANKQAAKFFHTKPSQFVLVASLSVKSLPVSSLSINGCKILPLVGRGKRYPIPRALAVHADGTEIEKHLQSTKYKLIRVKTEGRTPAEAAHRAFHALNLLRGYWNLLVTYGTSSMTFGFSPKKTSLGVIHTGPVSTLHNPDGSLVDGTYWFSWDGGPDRELFEPKRGWGASA